MATKQDTGMRPVRNPYLFEERQLRTDIMRATSAETTSELALQMTEDFGRSRSYWLRALKTGEE